MTTIRQNSQALKEKVILRIHKTNPMQLYVTTYKLRFRFCFFQMTQVLGADERQSVFDKLGQFSRHQ